MKNNANKANNAKNSKNTKKIIFIILRYVIAIAAALAVPIFYTIFRPLTIYTVFFLTNILYTATLQGTILLINSHSIEIINACIAGSAYLLLFILNMLISLDLKKRIIMLLVDYLLLFLFNVSRIIILIILVINNSVAFDITHKVFWYGISTIFVILIWFLNIKIFNIKKIPVYSDIKFILNQRK